MAGCLHMYTLMAADNSVWSGAVLDLCCEYSAECRQYEIHRNLKCYVTKCVIEERAGYTVTVTERMTHFREFSFVTNREFSTLMKGSFV